MGFSLKKALETEVDTANTIETSASANQTDSLEDTISNNGFETVFSFLHRNINKVENGDIIEVQHERVPADKYVFYITDEDTNANIVQIRRANELRVLANLTCEKINVHTNGISCNSPFNRTYITGSQVIQYMLDAYQFPIARIMFGRPSKTKPPEVIVTKSSEKNKELSEEKKLEMITVVIQSHTAKGLEKQIKEVKCVDEVKQIMLKFMQTRKDPLYRIKVEDILLNL